MSRRIFFVAGGRLQVYHHDGQLGRPIEFRADQDGLELFGQYLEQPSRDPAYVLVDLVEEEFREETVPHVFGGDRAAVVRTKLNRLFRDTTYCHAILQGRSKDGRRDDRMLFTALIRPDLLAPWMGQLGIHKTPVAGIYSLPLVSRALVKALKLDARNLLLVTLQSSGGLRQTYFLDGELKVSRLAMLPDTSPQAFTTAMLGEVERVRRYLNSLRMLPADEPLEVRILAPEGVALEVERHSPTSITARHQVVPLPEVARRVGIKGRYEERNSDRIFAHLLATRPSGNQYAPAGQTRYFRMHQMRRGLIAASVFLLMGSLAWSAATFVDGVSAIQDADGARKQATFYQSRYERARARLPATPTDPRNMKRVVEAVEKLERFRTSPLPLLQALSIGLEAFPRVQLDELQWRLSADLNAPADATATSPIEEGEGQRGGRRGGQREVPAPAQEDATLFQIALLTAHIVAFDGDYREALATVRRFAERLRQVPGVEEVRVESLPLDIGPEASLRGTAQGSARAASARFQLRVAVREDGVRA